MSATDATAAPTLGGTALSKRLRQGPLLTTPRGIVSIAMVALAVLVAVLAPLIAPFGPDAQTGTAFATPGAGNLLGTDEVGRDILSRTIFAMRLDLIIAVVAIPAGAIIGVLLGLSGILAPWLGQFSARLFDVIIGFPTIVLGIAIALAVSPGLTAVAVAIAVVNIPVFGRLARAGMLGQLNREYVMAARSLGATKPRLLRRHVLPNIRGTLLIQAAISVADAVFIEGGLSILGLGIQPPTPSLGSLVQTGLPYVQDAPMYVVAPTLALAWIILGFGLMADVLSRGHREL